MKLLRSLLLLISDDRGVGSIYMLLLLPLFLMLVGLGMDSVAAFRTRDMLQSTADATALAAALKLPVKGPAIPAQTDAAIAAAFSYATKNMSVAGFGNVLNPAADGATNHDIDFGNWDGTTFTQAPPASAGNAIRVTVRTASVNSNPLPTSFLALVGKSSWDISTTAIAMNGVPKPICVLGLHSFQVSGGPKIDLKGCDMAVNGPMDCNGSGIGAGYAVSSATEPNGNPACGTTNLYSQPPTPDPYAPLASNIPTNPCGPTAASYPQEVPGHGSNPPTLAASNRWPSGSGWPTGVSVDASTGAHIMCGDVQLTGNVSISGSETLVIENGRLDVGSNSLTTTGSGTLTIIFTGPIPDNTGLSPTRSIVGSSSGSVNIAGPTSGTWKQMAVYQDPRITCPSMPATPCSAEAVVEGGQGSGSGPIWNISGIVYLPNALFQISGLVSPASSAPNACITLVAYDISISGGGDILAEPACTNAPTTLLPISRLVQ